ncbi:hypothetical protein FIU85_21805 (plasmid) [Roseovarius sp. THAF8]|uniref:hypothetical protein n=1 Tax=Roseovarius sp. THAF8 TaxID=2587846 RepID=UPI0012A79AD4|nr:hypothetical protein [Roseovarius sp. THAF8]QFT99971.1 hypothetical protein FIU85_21805 [Roseovarius sp. THAF8]
MDSTPREIEAILGMCSEIDKPGEIGCEKDGVPSGGYKIEENGQISGILFNCHMI